MKYNNIIRYAILTVLTLGAATACVNKEFNEITALSLARCLQPQDLSARVNNATGVDVTFAWDVNKDAESYNLAVYKNEEMTEAALETVVESSEVPYIVKLPADTKYWFKVQACSEAREASLWAVYDGSVKTFAVKDNLFPEVVARTDNSVTLKWAQDLSDYAEVTHVSCSPVKGGASVKQDISTTDAKAAQVTVTGLEASTEYQVVLYYLSASRGALDIWTLGAQGAAVSVSSEAELIAALNAGGDIYLKGSGPYSVGTVKPAGNVRLIGEMAADGSKPVVIGKIEIADAFPAGGSIYAEGVCFDGGATNSRIVEHTGGTPTVSSIEFKNCEITNYQAGLFYGNNAGVIKIGSLIFDGCDIYSILGSGGDAVDIRQTTEIDKIVFTNNTIYDGMRTFFRIDAKDTIKIGEIDFENNTVKAVAVINDGNNQGLFALKVATSLTLKKNLFLYEDGGITGEDVDKAQLIRDNSAIVVPTLTAADNYSFAAGKDFFKKVSAAEAGCTVLSADPCYNSKGNFFQLANEDLIGKQIGASKWWISYVEKTEDLTQNAIASAHTWNLADAKLFAGDIKNSRVRDELLLVGTEATPLKAENGISFTTASALSNKGVPTEGYLSFIVTKAGSVDLQVSDKENRGGSVVVALADDNGFAVKGGAVARASKNEVEKIVVSPVNGEGTVYVYATGPITLDKLAWSEDTSAGSKVLPAPKLTVEPVTLTEGDETAVTVSWEAVPNAASYVVTFNKRAADPQTGLSFTVPAETIAELKAGLYNFSVQALPREDDIYYTKSEQGSASIAIQPKGGGGVEETHVLTWDFADSDWQAEFAKLGAVNTDIASADFTYDGLRFFWSSKCKYNTTFFQWGGKSSGEDRFMSFTAPDQGTLKVWASNTGNSEDLTRMVTVAVGDDVQSLPGGYKSGDGAVEIEFNVKAGEVKIYPTGNALRFYKVEFTYTTVSGGGAPAVEYDWDFAATDWQAEFGKLGAVNTDIASADFTYDGLRFFWSSKCKYNTTFFQWGGKSSGEDRFMSFTAPDQGTLKVWASNTGNSEDLTRMVTVAVGEDVQSLPGGYKSGDGAVEVEFSVKAGEVKIYPTGNALRFYRVYFTNK